MNTCIIVAAMATSCPFQKGEGDLLIAADAGYRNLAAAGLVPDLLVGDFDSLGEAPEVPCPVERHPVRKDDTDTLLAVKLGLKRGYREFHIYGGLGGRLDHTLANVQTLAYLAARGCLGFLAGERETLCLLREGALEFADPPRGATFSAFAYGGPAQGVTLRGLEYGLEGGTLTPEFPLGVSNAFAGGPASVQVETGALLLAWAGGLNRPGLRWSPGGEVQER